MANQIEYRSIPHIITRQNKLEETFLAEFAAGDYTLDQPLVKLDPYGICPLTAMLLFKTPVPTEVTLTVKGKQAPGDIRHTFPANATHILPVYGLYGGYDNTVEISTANGRSNSLTITTGPLRPDAAPATSIKTTPEYFGQNLMFLTSALTFLPNVANTLPVGLDSTLR